MVIVVLTPCVMIVITKDRRARVGKPVLVMGVGSSAVQWVVNCRAARGKLFGRDTDNLGGVLEQLGERLLEKHAREVESVL